MTCMKRLSWTSSIVFTVALAIMVQLVIINSVIAQASNTSLTQNQNITKIVDLEKNTITYVDKETNKTISVMNLTAMEVGNMTKNNTFTTNAGNVSTSEIPTPPINLIPVNNTKNVTTNESLTDKFNALQGK